MRMRFVIPLVVAAAFLVGPLVVCRTRLPAVAGTHYPAERASLQQTVQKFVDAAQVAAPEGLVVACIVPSSPYGLCGDVAGHVYKLLETGQYDRVIVLSPSHFSNFHGCSIAAVQTYRTPMGEVVLDGPAVRRITQSTLLSLRSVRYNDVQDRTRVHEQEYGIETVLPFLQTRLGFFRLVPIVVSDLSDHSGKTNEHLIETVARQLRGIINDRTLVVVSSDFTHHGNAYSYRPFRQNVLEGVEQLDKEAFGYILNRDYRGFQAYLERTRNTIYGQAAIGVLLKLLPEGARGHMLAYDISARKTKDLTNAVGYGAIAFIDPTRPVATPNPAAALPPPRSDAPPLLPHSGTQSTAPAAPPTAAPPSPAASPHRGSGPPLLTPR